MIDNLRRKYQKVSKGGRHSPFGSGSSNRSEQQPVGIGFHDPDQGERIVGKFITEEMANQYFAMFWGRTDVYAKRGRNGGLNEKYK